MKVVMDSMDNNHDHVVSVRELKTWLFPSHIVDTKILARLKALIIEKFQSVEAFVAELQRCVTVCVFAKTMFT